MTAIHLAICADRNVEVGLHVTLHSAMNSLHPDATVVAHLFLKNFNDKAIKALESTLQEFGSRCRLMIYDADGIEVGEGIGLHGNKMPYLLFQIPALVDASRVLCLDADLLITADLTEVFEWNLEGKVAGVVFGAKVRHCWSAERDFLMSIGISEEAVYFNTGVVLIDVTEWRRQDLTSRCLAFAASHKNSLHTADQTVLNAVLREQVALLPDKYNRVQYPTSPTLDPSTADGIHHFVGSPKPWDFMGEFLHFSYSAFQKHLLLTYHRNYKSFKNVSFAQAVRTIRLSRSYYKALRAYAHRK